ncbi:MAG: divergent PAP2 family protein [Spirochaetaceae bacterium]|jgi:acid phosphatase family membrane protein YuiD|nr:divergent PAP2 family protein [Spirochaetaceae bacterium]
MRTRWRALAGGGLKKYFWRIIIKIMNTVNGNFGAFISFIQNPLFLSGLTSFVFAQFIKLTIATAVKARRNRKELLKALFWKTGGMPSSHAAAVSALTVTMAIQEGINSDLFILTLFFSMIVLRDAVGVRHSSGIQAKTLNTLGRALSERFQIEYHPVKEVQGHKPLEVIVGCFIGFFIAAAYAYL